MSNLPKKSEIVRWWNDFFYREYRTKGYYIPEKYPIFMWIDIGEPDCWTCGRHDPRFGDIGIYLDEKGIDNDEYRKNQDKYLWQMWNATRLERHHIIAKSRDGVDTPDNLVLLCSFCHKQAPHTSDPDLFWSWAKNRHQEIFDKFINSIKSAVEALGLNLEDEIKYVDYLMFAMEYNEHPLYKKLNGEVAKLLTAHFEGDPFSIFRDKVYCALKVAKSEGWTLDLLKRQGEEIAQ